MKAYLYVPNLGKLLSAVGRATVEPALREAMNPDVFLYFLSLYTLTKIRIIKKILF